jgi:hypothetical protein
MQDFVEEAVLAYECGLTEAELQRLLEPALQDLQRDAGAAGPQSLLARSMEGFSTPGFLQCVYLVW